MRINKSASRAIDIINLISKKESSVTITEISNALDIPKSSAFELLYTLVEKGYLEIENENYKTFNLGIKLFEAGASFLAKTDLHKEAWPFLESAAFKSGETAFLGTEDDGDIVYLDKVEGPSLIRTTAILGSRNPMHCTGLGKALLAAYPEKRVQEIVSKKGFIKRSQNTITNYEDLIKDLEAIRARGYSIDDREGEDELYCFAAPIYDLAAKPIAAISITTIPNKIDDLKHKEFSSIIVEAAMSISKRLGYLGNKLY
jgi:DNA-binding IclR family transcriptional regulator